MIYKNILIFLIYSFLTSQTYPELGSLNKLDIMTWNIENFPKHNNTIDYVIDIINDINIDIIALQEIEDQDEFHLLFNNLDGDWIGYRAGNSNYGELSYLINTEHLSIIQAPYIILSQYEHYFAYRPPYVLKINFNNQDYTIINVHSKCCGDGILENNYWDEEYRRLQSNYYLKQYIDTYFFDDSVIVLGDFNDDIVEDNINNVFSDFITDEDNYFFADTHIAEGASSEWSFPNWPSHLDHILITNELFSSFDIEDVFTFKVDDYMDGWQQYDYYISDHRPVVINIDTIIYGDINGDGNINILDITMLINMILNNSYNDFADLNSDGGLNILDVVILVNLILS